VGRIAAAWKKRANLPQSHRGKTNEPSKKVSWIQKEGQPGGCPFKAIEYG
jgi:hypothetical protein